MLAMAGLLLASCADKDVIAEGGGTLGEEHPDGYMSVNINLPTTPITRAANDRFDDGLADEYNVNDCALLLFQGDDEENALLLSAQPIVLPFDDETNDGKVDNITTTYQATAQVKGHTAGEKLWALALLNYKEVMSIDNELPTFKSLKGSTPTKSLTVGARLSEIRDLITNANLTTRGGSRNYFFMTNAVLSTVPGGGHNPLEAHEGTEPKIFQLAYLDPSKIKETMEEAKKEPAGEIFVERAVAKATLSINSTFEQEDNFVVDKTTNDRVGLNLPIEKIEWIIDNKEPYTYVTRNPGKQDPTADPAVNEQAYIGYTSGYFPNGNYRFVGEATLKGLNGTLKPNLTSETKAYRTYWCVDPQYNVEAKDMLAASTKTEGGKPVTDFSPVGTDYPLYCHENTFDVEHQSYRNTTRAIIKVTLKDKQVFYTLNGGQERYIDDDVPATGKPAGWKSGLDKINTHVVGYVINKTAVVNALKLALKKGESSGEIAGLFHIDYNRDETTGQYKIESIYVDQEELNDVVNEERESVFEANAADIINKVFAKDETGKSDFIDEVNKEYVVRSYEDGVMYYEARFQHFAGAQPGVDDLAPWNVKNTDNYENTWETTPSGGSTDAAYNWKKSRDKAEKNYLGRYGMVRNNWYDVEITAINKIGYPADPSGQVDNEDFDDPDTPDDNILDYISAKIHVLSWAKRTQGWQF